jgi:hypothetical protein
MFANSPLCEGFRMPAMTTLAAGRGAGVPKASREGTRGEEFCGGALYGDFGIVDRSAARLREGREQGSTALGSVRDGLW